MLAVKPAVSPPPPESIFYFLSYCFGRWYLAICHTWPTVNLSSSKIWLDLFSRQSIWAVDWYTALAKTTYSFGRRPLGGQWFGAGPATTATLSGEPHLLRVNKCASPPFHFLPVLRMFFLSGVSHLFFFIFLCHIFYFLLKWIICNFFLYYLFPGSTLVNRLTSQLPEYCTSLAVAYNAVALPLLYKFYSDPDPVQNLSAHPNPGVRFNAGPKHCNL
jgi:hypothetical protein